MVSLNGAKNGTSNGTNGINGANGHTLDLQEIHDFLIELSAKAGEMIMNAHPLVDGVGSKKNSADLVTETDQAVEKMVSNALMSTYPHYEFLGEETYKPGVKLTDAPTFVIDPIDGTINFVHSFPNACISLGFCIKRRPVVGVVFNPFTNTLYTAISGRGAYMNRKLKLPLKGENVEPLNGLSNALVGVEWGTDRSGPNWQTKLRTIEQLGKSSNLGGAMVHSMRSMGSAALNFCAVAAGTLDLFWEGGCWAWDVCAGWIILTEAGGIVAECTPGKWEAQVDGRKYLAVRGSPDGKGQKEIVEELWANMQGEFVYPS